MNYPLVSICIPTYNGESFLEDSISSAISQTYEKIEIIISDDNSIDRTIEIVENFKLKTKKTVKIINHLPNGIGANWNNCVTNASGEYIKFLFQDDILEPECVEEMMNLILNNQKDIGMVFCRRKIIYQKLNRTHIEWLNKYKELHTHWDRINFENKSIIEGKELLKDKNIFKSPLNKIGEPTAVLIKKKCFDKVGFFDLELKQALDIEYWYRLMKYFKIGFINKELVSFRLHDQQATALNSKNKINESKIFNRKKINNIFWQLNFRDKIILLSNVNFFIGKIIQFLLKIRKKFVQC